MGGGTTKLSPDPVASENADAKTAHDDHLKHVLALLPLLSAFGVEALKSAVLINGGTAAALLTFVGQKGLTSQPELGFSLRIFAVGLLLGAIATGLAYIAQFSYATASQKYIKIFVKPYINFLPAHRNWNFFGFICHVLSIIMVAVSYMLAVYGFYTAGQKLPI